MIHEILSIIGAALVARLGYWVGQTINSGFAPAATLLEKFHGWFSLKVGTFSWFD